MSELKTLKDLEAIEARITVDHGTGSLGYNVVDIRKLKEEAIKWIKHYHQLLISSMDTPHQRDTNGAKITVLMDFFNITKEDLKDE